MKVQAVVVTITALVDIDEMKPDLGVDVDIDPVFSFLASHVDIIGGWVEKAGQQMKARQPPPVPGSSDRTEGE